MKLIKILPQRFLGILIDDKYLVQQTFSKKSTDAVRDEIDKVDNTILPLVEFYQTNVTFTLVKS